MSWVHRDLCRVGCNFVNGFGVWGYSRIELGGMGNRGNRFYLVHYRLWGGVGGMQREEHQIGVHGMDRIGRWWKDGVVAYNAQFRDGEHHHCSPKLACAS